MMIAQDASAYKKENFIHVARLLTGGNSRL